MGTAVREGRRFLPPEHHKIHVVERSATFHIFVELINLANSSTYESEAEVRERAVELARGVLVETEKPYKSILKERVKRRFHHLIDTSPLGASRVYSAFLRSEVMDEDSLRNTLELPPIPRRRFC
jgi:hypothetical protein